MAADFVNPMDLDSLISFVDFESVPFAVAVPIDTFLVLPAYPHRDGHGDRRQWTLVVVLGFVVVEVVVTASSTLAAFVVVVAEQVGDAGHARSGRPDGDWSGPSDDGERAERVRSGRSGGDWSGVETVYFVEIQERFGMEVVFR